MPVYWFAGYAYEEGLVPLAENPVTGSAGTANCANPPEAWAVDSLGAMGLFRDGVFACPQGQSTPPEGGGVFGWEGGPESPIGGDPLPDASAITFVELGTTTTSAFMEGLRSLKEAHGLHVLVGLAPDGLICRTSEGQRQALNADVRATLVTTETIPGIPPATAEDLQAGEPGFAKRAWNAMLIPPSPPDTTVSETFPSCIVGNEDPIPQPHATWQTSIYMMGDVGVSLLFLESEDDRECNHSQQIHTENWTIGERNTACTNVADGLVDLASLAPDHGVTFLVVETPVLDTTVEPVQLNSYDSGIWKGEAMEQLGYTTGYAEEPLREFVNDRRSEYETDWWIAGFMIRDVCDEDHRFADGHVSYASPYGPSMVLLYLNGFTYPASYLATSRHTKRAISLEPPTSMWKARTAGHRMAIFAKGMAMRSGARIRRRLVS